MRHANKIIALLLITTSLMLVGCWGDDENKKEVIKIGAILPLTGGAAVWGINSKNGIEIARKHFDKDNDIEIIYLDSKSKPADAVAALEKIISTNKDIKVIIGDIASSNVLAMSSTAEKNKIILLSPGASNPDISNAGDYIFRNWQSDSLEAVADLDYAKQNLKWAKVATLYINNAYGKGLEKVFVDRASKENIKIIKRLTFQQDQKDFRSLISKLKTLNIDGIYMPGYPVEMGLILKQMKEIKYQPKILATQAFDDPQIAKVSGDISNVIYSTPKPPSIKSPTVARFKQSYKNTYNVESGVTSDTGYDAFMIFYNIYKKHNFKNISSDIIKKELYKMQVNGASGKYNFDKNGDVIKEFIFIRK